MTIEPKDMPKLESPFIRVEKGKDYVVTPEINAEHSWVFEEDDVIASEKIDGTNVSIVIEDGVIKSIWNRKNRVFLITGDSRINEGLVEASKKGYIPKTDGQHFGELIGPDVNRNPCKVEKHIWIPFTYLREHCAYKSFHNYPKTFENLSNWFEKDIFSLFMRKRGLEGTPEGIVFYRPKTGEMCKLRRDMFEWFKGRRQTK